MTPAERLAEIPRRGVAGQRTAWTFLAVLAVAVLTALMFY